MPGMRGPGAPFDVPGHGGRRVRGQSGHPEYPPPFPPDLPPGYVLGGYGPREPFDVQDFGGHRREGPGGMGWPDDGHAGPEAPEGPIYPDEVEEPDD